MRIFLALIASLAFFPLGGCVSAAVELVKLPVRAAGAAVDAAGAAVDAATVSQAEADEKRGREIRKAEEREGKAARERERKRREAEPESDY